MAEVGPFVEVSAPWELTGEYFCLFGYNFAGNQDDHGQRSPGICSYGPLEGSEAFSHPAQSGEFQGGLYSIIIVRYKTSPIGPYDELAWCPGSFMVPPTGKKSLRVTRIYVSSTESVYNGRKNWNVCKQLAHFTFVPSYAISPTENPYSRVEVYPPGEPDKPFFALNFSPTMLFSSGRIPFDSSRLPMSMELVSPPLPQSPAWQEDGRVGTGVWMSCNPRMTGKAGLFRASGGLEGGKIGDDIGYPDVSPWQTGMWLRDLKVTLPQAIELGKKDK